MIEIREYPVRDVTLGGTSGYDRGTLKLDGGELRSLVLEDTAFEDATIELASPGENVRITFICDAADARMMVGGAGEAYPGMLGAPEPVRNGRVNVLTGLAIMMAGEIPSVFRGQRSTLLDMHHARPETPFHRTYNLVVAFKLRSGLPDVSYHDAILKAELRVARRVAEVTLTLDPENIGSCAWDEGDHKRPGVILVQALRGHKDAPPYWLYGHGMYPGRMPMFVHPAEFCVGAVTTSPLVGAGTYPSTWFWCNHPVVRALSRFHGDALNFLGAFLHVRPDTRAEKEFIAHRIALQAKAMGASGAIIGSIVTGNAVVDNMMACRELEAEGIKVVYLTHEYSPDNAGPRLPFLVPEADAIVSTGTGETEVELGPARRIIGPADIPLNMDIAPNIPRVSARDPFKAPNFRAVFGSIDLLGDRFDMIREY